MKKVLLSLLLLCSLTSFSQSVNDYQYVVVPIKFDVLKENDRFRLNTTSKFLLQKYTFKSFLSNEVLPDEVASDRCKALYANMVEENSLFLTKVKVQLKDCQDRVVYETAFGSSRIKNLAQAYNEALRDAFKSFDKLNYKYKGKTETVVEAVVPSVPAAPVAEAPAVPAPKTNHVLEATAEPLFAKPFGDNGFQLLTNNTDVPRYVMTIYKTSSPDCYIANSETLSGVLLKKSGKWYVEYYKENQLISKPMTIVNLN